MDDTILAQEFAHILRKARQSHTVSAPSSTPVHPEARRIIEETVTRLYGERPTVHYRRMNLSPRFFRNVRHRRA